MRKTRVWMTLWCGFFVLAGFAGAQTRKTGLWEMTTTMKWQQAPFPTGMADAASLNSSAHVSQSCLTQQQIDKYGAILPQTRSGCEVTNVVKKADGMTADMVCAGRMNGKGNVESTWTDAEHAKGSVHFVGSMQMGPNSKPVEWTTQSTSIFKGADCGAVKPVPMPDK